MALCLHRYRGSRILGHGADIRRARHARHDRNWSVDFLDQADHQQRIENDRWSATTPAVISDPNIASDAEVSFIVTGIGDGTAKGAKMYVKGYRP
jgi:hypothetical protein